MSYKYYCAILDSMQETDQELTEKDILCKSYQRPDGFCEMEFHGCPHQRENIFNLKPCN